VFRAPAARDRGLPGKIRVDNGSEFTGKVLDQWAYVNKVRLDFSRRGKPTDNGLIEAFNGRLSPLKTGFGSSQVPIHSRASRLYRMDSRPQDMPYDIGPEVDPDRRDQAFLHVPLPGNDPDDAAQHKHLGDHDRW
jgi:transposase InsO family protein